MKPATINPTLFWAALLATALLASPVDAALFKQNKKTPTSGVREPVLNYETKPVAAAEIADLAIVLPPPEVNANWAQPGGNAAKSMGQLSLPETLTKAWSVSIGKGSDKTRRLNAPPMVYQGRVLTIDTIGDVRVFDTETGKLVWNDRIFDKSEGNEPAFGGGVSADDGRVFAVTGYGIVAAYDLASRKELWRVHLNTPLRGAPAISDGKVFTLSADNQIFALNASRVYAANGTIK